MKLNKSIRNRKESLYDILDNQDGVWTYDEKRKFYCIITSLKYCCPFVITSSIIHKLARSWLHKQEVLFLSDGNAQCSSLLSFAVINRLSKGSLGGRGLLGLQYTVHHGGKQMQEVKASTQLQNKGKTLFIVLLLFVAQHLCYTAQAHLPKHNTAHSGLIPPTSISNQGNAPKLATGQSDRGDFSSEILSSLICFRPASSQQNQPVQPALRSQDLCDWGVHGLL